MRPACTACAHVTKRPNAIIEHPPGEETQFDWFELPDAPVGSVFPTKNVLDFAYSQGTLVKSTLAVFADMLGVQLV